MVEKEEEWLETTGLQSFADCGLLGSGERKVTLKGQEVEQIPMALLSLPMSSFLTTYWHIGLKVSSIKLALFFFHYERKMVNSSQQI